MPFLIGMTPEIDPEILAAAKNLGMEDLLVPRSEHARFPKKKRDSKPPESCSHTLNGNSGTVFADGKVLQGIDLGAHDVFRASDKISRGRRWQEDSGKH